MTNTHNLNTQDAEGLRHAGTGLPNVQDQSEIQSEFKDCVEYIEVLSQNKTKKKQRPGIYCVDQWADQLVSAEMGLELQILIHFSLGRLAQPKTVAGS